MFFDGFCFGVDDGEFLFGLCDCVDYVVVVDIGESYVIVCV